MCWVMQLCLFLESCQSTNKKINVMTPRLGELFWKCQHYPNKIACVWCHPAWPRCQSAEVSIISTPMCRLYRKASEISHGTFSNNFLWVMSRALSGYVSWRWKIKTPVQVKDAKSPQPMLIYKLRSHPKTPCFLSSCTCSKCVRCIFHIDVYQVAEMLSRWSREGRVVVGCGPWPSTTASIPPFPPPPPTHPPFIILIIQILFSEMWELILLSFSANERTARNTG